MKQVNNYLKNGVLILVAGMLLAIPSLNVYSSIGSYQSSSSAIVVNVDYKKHSHVIGKALLAPFDLYGMSKEEFMELAAILADQDTPIANISTTCGYHPLSLKTKNYAKYDFSGFDN